MRNMESLQDFNNRKARNKQQKKKRRIAFKKAFKSLLDQENSHVKNNKHQRFYCTVCKMKTWTYHEHGGLNTSSTIKNVTNKFTDITNNL